MSFLKIHNQILKLSDVQRKDLFKHLLVLGRNIPTSEELESQVLQRLVDLNREQLFELDGVDINLSFYDAKKKVILDPKSFVLKRDSWNKGTFTYLNKNRWLCIQTANGENVGKDFTFAHYSPTAREWVVYSFPPDWQHLLD